MKTLPNPTVLYFQIYNESRKDTCFSSLFKYGRFPISRQKGNNLFSLTNVTISDLSPSEFPFYFQDKSCFFVLSNSNESPLETENFLWVELLDGHMYYMLPSIQPNSGRISYYTGPPSFLDDLSSSLYIGEVKS